MFNSGFLNTIILLGAIQGLILAVLLFFVKNNRMANRLLAALILLIALACLNLYLEHQNWYTSIAALRVISAIVPLMVIMPFGPLLYFYVRFSLDPDFILTRKTRSHFYSVFLDLVPYIVASIYGITLLTGFVKKNDGPGNFINTYNTYVDIPRWISFTAYLVLTARYIYTARDKEKKPIAIKASYLRWLQQVVHVLLFFQIIWLIHLIPYLIPRYSTALLNWGDWYPLYIPLAILIYWLGIKGYFFAREYPAFNLKTGRNTTFLPACEESIALLIKAMEQDHLYLDPNLNLAMLSQHTGLTQRAISIIVNQELGKSFTEFVNGYRVMAIMDKLLNPENRTWTIAGVAFDCGFNSQPTFQRAFKTINGVTPKEFLLKNTKRHF
jgi:AraC-like DNA-binding protein